MLKQIALWESVGVKVWNYWKSKILGEKAEFLKVFFLLKQNLSLFSGIYKL